MRKNYPIYYTKKKVENNMDSLTDSEVSGGYNCDSNVNTRTETYAADLLAM